MKIAKVFTNGNSQAVRLPKEFRLDVTEVFIKKVGDAIVLMPKAGDRWANVRAAAALFKGDMERNQPKKADERDWPEEWR